ncbi:putative mitochondrial protein [Tanacetum coccineum]
MMSQTVGWCDSRIHHQLDSSFVMVDPWEELGQLLIVEESGEGVDDGDYGSTHNFLDLQTTKRLECKMKSTCPLLVTVANGQDMTTTFMCQKLALSVGDMAYEVDVMVLPLGACEMVLEEIDEKIEAVVRDLEDVFVLPTALPPKRSHDHQIQLLPNTLPINVRPCRHPPMRKDAIEQMVNELLESGVIRHIEKVEYLGHVISAQGVAIDPAKLAVPTNQAVISSPVLALPDFNKEFIVETGACRTGIGAVLQQEGHPIAYLSKALSKKHQSLSTYEKEFLVVILALENGKGYDYEFDYKKGCDNSADDALLRVDNQAELASLVVVETNDTGKYTWSNGQLSRMQVTIKNLAVVVYWKKMRRMIKQLVRECDQSQKSDLSAYPGLLQPLSIPNRIWTDISMDFVEALPSSQGKSDVFAVVDRLSKYAHFMALKHPFTDTQVAQVFMENVYKLHGLPERIIKLQMSTAYHPKYGQTEVVNRCVECFLRCMTGERPKEWTQWLALTEYWAQDKMKNQADKHRTDRSYEVGDWVYLKLQPYRKVRQNPYHRLSAKYYGPFLVCAKVGQVAYELHLPSDSLIHPVFHVSQLEKCKGLVLERGISPQVEKDGLLYVQPMAISDKKLVHWSNYDADGATWKVYDEVMQRFLSFLS